MRLHRTTTALAALLVLGSLGACADYTTTGVPSDEETAEESEHGAEGNPLQGTSWVLTEAATPGEEELGEAGITADFFDEQMSGQAPVNSYFTEYVVEGESVEFGEIGATLMAGSAKAMAAETVYFELLGSVTTFEVAADTLLLKADGAEVLEYVPADQAGSSTDVEGTTATTDITAFAATLVEMPVEDAETAATDAGYEFRVVSVDGEPGAATSDYREDRINVDIEDDVVVTVNIG